MVVIEGPKTTLWLSGLLDNLGIKQEYVDHFVRHAIDDDNISLMKVRTNENSADMFTKV
jgi:hypothetical protein